jgi:hypothetical protein
MRFVLAAGKKTWTLPDVEKANATTGTGTKQ